MHHVSTIYARFICRELGLTANQANPLLCGSDLKYQDINRQAQMPYPDFFSFLRHTRQQYSDSGLGLRVGSQLTPPSLGELGSAMLCAPTLADAVTLAVTFVPLHADYYRLEQISSATGIRITFIELTDLGMTQQFQTEVMMQLVQNLIEAITCEPFRQGQFYFPYHQPQHAHQYQEFFHSPCHFGAEHAALDIPQQILQSASPFCDADAWQHYQRQLQQKLRTLTAAADPAPYSSHVRRFLASGPLPLASADDAAASLNMTSRSLSRYLKSEGSSFRDIRHQLLKEYAAYYLTESDLTVDAIASQLGYQDFSSFRRAFKQWYGCSPTTFRNTRDAITP